MPGNSSRQPGRGAARRNSRPAGLARLITHLGQAAPHYKAIQHKMRRKDFTKLLKLPLVPTWVSYVDAVVCILVLHRLLNLLESSYGNPYAWVGGITAYEKETKELFTAWNWQRAHPRELEDWAKAFFQSLSAQHQDRVGKKLGGHLDAYLNKNRPKIRVPSRAKRSVGAILKALQSPPKKPDFLSKPPPHLSTP